MRRNEVIIKIVDALHIEYEDNVDVNKVKEIIESIMYNYKVEYAETSIATLDNMSDMILLYLASRKIEGLSENTIKQYGRTLGKFANHIRKNVEDVTTMDARIYIANFSKTGVKNTTIATHTDIIRKFFGWLTDEGYIEKNPISRIKTPKVEKRIREALTKEEFEIFKTGAKTLRQKALVSLFYSTGCRLEEVEQMKKSDIDWQRLQIKVIGKGNKQRIVYINANAQVHLRKYIMSRLDDCDALFVTERTPIKYMSRSSIQREIKKVMEQSGLKKNVYPHLLRHTFSTHMLNSGIDITVLQKILGHDSADTTLIYAELDNKTVEYEYRKYS